MSNPNPTVFTKIINREIPADIIYEDDALLAFLDINPVNYGHTLIIPKKPAVNILDVEEDVLSNMMTLAKRVSKALVETSLADGVNVVTNAGEEAGQEVFHIHLHVIPRLKEDGKGGKFNHENITAAKQIDTAEKLKKELGK